MTWTLHLPIDLPSANRHGGAATNARHAATGAQYRRQRESYALALRYAAHAAGISPPTTPRTVTIVRLWAKGCRAWDDDNMVAACKGLRDAMQSSRVRGGKTILGAGIVVDDSAKWSAWRYAQRKSPDGRPGVEVTVEEINPSAPDGAEETER